MRWLAFAALLAPAALVAQVPVITPFADLPPELDRVLRDYERAWSQGDTEALAALFTADGFVPSRAGWRRGADAIRDQYGGASGPLQLRAHAWAVADTVGYIVGAYGYGGPTGGKFLLALRRGADGRWLIAADLDNANRPPEGEGSGP